MSILFSFMFSYLSGKSLVKILKSFSFWLLKSSVTFITKIVDSSRHSQFLLTTIIMENGHPLF